MTDDRCLAEIEIEPESESESWDCKLISDDR
jgi:hypothetical protein